MADEAPPQKKRRGFAAMSAAKQRELASRGGRKAQDTGKAHRWTAEQARQHAPSGGVARHAPSVSRAGTHGAESSPQEGRRLMHNLATALQHVEDQGSADYDAGVRALQTAAEEWAVYSLRTFRGDHLTAALGIATAISQFAALLTDDTADGG